MRRLWRMLIVLTVAGLAGAGGCVGGYRLAPRTVPGAVVPLPHHHPPTPGGASFRFAMIHDVLHERYPKHGPAFYRERERLARDKLKTLPPDSDEAFALADDIAAGLNRLGNPADAVPLLHDKLKRQEARGLTGRDLYTTYANLGTFLYFAHMGKAFGGDATAKAACEEGIAFVEKSVAVNPDSHFGREKWQVVILRFLLDAADKPKLLTERDFLGNRFDREFSAAYFRPAEARSSSEPEPYPLRSYPAYLLVSGADHITRDRKSITRVGEEQVGPQPADWQRKDGHPFDDPMLGVIGMWRQGGGASPHFAVCVGETMLRVGQRRLAWAGFERAARMAERYSPDVTKQQFLRDHCAKRQRFIEGTLNESGTELRAGFDAELAAGEGYQRAYQEYEAGRIASGADLHGEHFFDEFDRGHPPISTPPGPEEWLVTEREDYVGPPMWAVAFGLFAAGVGAMLAAVVLRRASAPPPAAVQ